MVDTAFDRAERGLGSTDLSVADIVAKTRGNPNEIMKLVMAGQINLTQGLLAKRLSDSVVAEQQKAAMPQTTVLQDSFPQLAPAMGGLQPPAAPVAPPAPQGMGPVAPQMAEGGLAQLDFAAPDYAGGGIVAFAAGDPVPAPEEEEEEMLYGLPASLFEAPELDLAGARQEVTGLLPQASTALEAFRARLGEEEDPAKARERAELGALFQSIGNVRPGMNPLEALAQGFATSGASMQAAEERGRERELQRLEGLMNLENAQNQRERDLYTISVQLAEARRSGADAAVVRRLEAAREEIKREYEAEQARLDREADMARTLVQESGANYRASRSGGGGGGGGGEAEPRMTRTAANDTIARANSAMPDLLQSANDAIQDGDYERANSFILRLEDWRRQRNEAHAFLGQAPYRRDVLTADRDRLAGWNRWQQQRRRQIAQGRGPNAAERFVGAASRGTGTGGGSFRVLDTE